MAILRLYNNTSSLPCKIAFVQLVITRKVVVLIPPPVPPGLAPINMRAIIMNNPALVIFPISILLKPAVLVVTD